MHIFLSWSGDRSKAAAEAFKDWIVQVIQAAQPWMSTGIEKGSRWSPELAENLQKAQIGIVFLTPENLTAPWLLFESGAIAKHLNANVCTFLLERVPSDVSPPLGDFQHTVFEKEDVRKLCHTINKKLEDNNEARPLSLELLDKSFDRCWPDLDEALKTISSQTQVQQIEHRDQGDILNEILDIVRAQEGRFRRIEEDRVLFEGARPKSIADLFEQYVRHSYEGEPKPTFSTLQELMRGDAPRTTLPSE